MEVGSAIYSYLGESYKGIHVLDSMKRSFIAVSFSNHGVQ